MAPLPWRPAPKADLLRLVLYLTILGAPCCAPALPSCKEDEYPVGTECCPKCSPGYRVKQPCEELTGTVCEPCPPGTYIAHLNGLSKCLKCQMCDPAMGLLATRNCSRTENTLCSCGPGHFCVLQDGDHCAVCQAHATSSPDQRVQKGGTEGQDTLCQNCPPGTFSPSGTLEGCQHWTKCSSWLETEARPGTSSSPRAWPLVVIIIVIVIVIVVPTLGLIMWRKRRRRRRGDFQMNASLQEAGEEQSVTEALQTPPHVTTVAEVETTPTSTGESPNH
ncbi:tumor necrosis factor receptor superfamily member 14 [Callithrix jacchus]